MTSLSKPLRNELTRPFGDQEGLALEFKRAADRLPANFFETVCAFLNMDGGLIVLGVEDDGSTIFPKNPTICRFMLQMGRYEQAGSGVYNVTKYLPIYTPGTVPVFEEYADVFETTIPLLNLESVTGAQVTPEVTPQVAGEVAGAVTGAVTGVVTAQVAAQVTAQVAECCRNQAQPAKTIMESLGLRHWKTFQTNYLLPLIHAGILERTIPDKPRSGLQKYRLTAKGRALLADPSTLHPQPSTNS